MSDKINEAEANVTYGNFSLHPLFHFLLAQVHEFAYINSAQNLFKASSFL